MPRRNLSIDIDDQMIEAAVSLGAGIGLENVTTMKVGIACGVAEPTVYRHFVSKENLLFQAYLSIDNELAKIIDKLDFSVPSKVKASAKAVWKDTFEYFLSHREETSYYIQYRHSIHYNTAMEMERSGAFGTLYKKNLDAAKDKSGDFAMISDFVVDNTVNFAEKIHRGQLQDTDELREFMSILVINTITTKLLNS